MDRDDRIAVIGCANVTMPVSDRSGDLSPPTQSDVDRGNIADSVSPDVLCGRSRGASVERTKGADSREIHAAHTMAASVRHDTLRWVF
jgi:hypothetical protein